MQVVLKRANVTRALALIRQHPGISRAELARALHLTKSSVSDAVQNLLRVGLVYEGGQGHITTSGRKPRQLVFARDFGQIIAIDLGGTTLRAAVADLDGTILARTQDTIDRWHLEDQLADTVAKMLAHKRAARPVAIGIGVAGTVDRTGGTVLDAPALERSSWNIMGCLRTVTSLPVALDNDVNLAALGEQWRGAARGHRNVVCLSIGTGIGAGLIIDGYLYRGARGLAGEAGHLYQHPEGPAQAYDTFGDLELQAAGFGIAQRAKKSLVWATSRKSDVSDPRIPLEAADAHAVFLAAEKGDRPSVEIIEHAATQIGIAVGNIISLLDPEVVVLLGGIGLGQVARLLPMIRGVIRRITPPVSRDQVVIVGGELGDDAVLVGAACAGQQMLGLQ